MSQRKKQKIIIIVVSAFLVVYAILAGVSTVVLKYKHSNEINSKITTMGGTLIEYESVSLQESPFDSDSRGANKLFKITYSKNGKIMIAWYRAIKNPIDIHQPSSRTLGEKVIFEQ
ncbi:hypothetical protein [Brevibacillus porteri]|uniref:hypothetical protein n=1 Tax=Brevibacillus porteri TaxID=2126350 RepID=UPI0036398B3B